jgi:hypothetical protein
MAVRIFNVFGQDFPFFLPACPKVLCVRTPTLVFSSNLSEDSSCSDSITSFFFLPVRRCLVFGQQHSFFLPACPKVLRVRTPTLVFSSNLSEDSSCSDTNTRFFLPTCPKIPRVRTASLVFSSCLSEGASNLSIYLSLFVHSIIL